MTGRLKLSIYLNYGLLTIHIIKAKNLDSNMKSLGSFVKLSLVPDEIKRTRCQTGMTIDTINPVFDEKFSFELLEEDQDKRLLFSVWCGDHGNKVYEFCGCMSFGVKNLTDPCKNSVRGWYCLLDEDTGRRKHLQYSSGEKTKMPTKNLEKPMKNFKMETRRLKIRRGEEGFGFTVPNVSPVSVGYVSVGSPSEKAGLRPGDTILRVNGVNVSGYTAPSVIKLVNLSWEYLIIEIKNKCKEITIEKFEKSPWKPFLSRMKNTEDGVRSLDDDDRVMRSRKGELSLRTRPVCRMYPDDTSDSSL